MTSIVRSRPAQGVTVVVTEPPADPVDVALVGLYDRHYATLVRVAVLLVRDRETAEDVVQDAFVDMCRRWPRLRDREAAAGYLRTAVVNRSRSVLRHRKVVDRQRPERTDTAPGADESVLSRSTRTAVLDALAALPRRQREVLVLRYYLDLSESEIAQTLGISRGSVKTHASRAASALREALEPDGGSLR
ncbi:RNA polymerase sigma factor [Nocardioides terrisoli]|uniref:RNA polymerase sigma factor n=1 Tax=Nocardioides terrisoli TaxID=3388267 RepID=UPI00287BBFB2|nr:SigE family RNA polymerase sigma factor [Nocardioides marmorisolisilvae]